jgi:hypothetical protein
VLELPGGGEREGDGGAGDEIYRSRGDRQLA